MNKEIQVSASTVIDKETYRKLREICKSDRRSISSQIAILIDAFVNSNYKEK